MSADSLLSAHGKYCGALFIPLTCMAILMMDDPALAELPSTEVPDAEMYRNKRDETLQHKLALFEAQSEPIRKAMDAVCNNS